MKPHSFQLLISFILILSLSRSEQSALAASVVLGPSADTTLQEAFPGNNLGGGTSFQAGGRRQGGAARGLLQFNVAGNVPAGATIDSVTLTLNVTATPFPAVNSVFDLHRVLASWGEGNKFGQGGAPASPNEATWNNRFAPGTAWASPGGDFSPVVSASRAIAGDGSYVFSSTANLVSDVQSWLDLPGNNFGWLLDSQSESIATTIRRFGSRDSGASAPSLSIQFTPIPEPGIAGLLALGALALWWVPRRNRRIRDRS